MPQINYLTMDTTKSTLDAVVYTMCWKCLPNGFSVGDDASVPNTWEALKDHIAISGEMLVYSGHSDKTIFGSPEINWCFRAWHDWCHLMENADFSPQGEKLAAIRQIEDMYRYFGRSSATDNIAHIIWAEIVGQGAYLERYGDFPKDQAAFSLAYMQSPEVALSSQF